MGNALENKRKLREYAENLGPRANPPTTRLDGSPLVNGDTYYQNGEGMKVYANGWAAIGTGGGGGSVGWTDITGKPSTFTPSAHTHVIADVTGLQAELNAKQATLVSATNIKTVNGTSLLGSGNIVVGSGGNGTVTTVSVATANGFAGTVATATSTPVITLTTSLTGLLKGDGTAMSAAVAGTDFVAPGGALGTPSSGALTNCTADGTSPVGFRNIPQNSQVTTYTCVLADAGKHILHPSADTTARTFTIPANASVTYPVGTAITFINQNAAGVVTISINSDTMRLAGAGTTGSRTLAANGVATAIKITSTEWIISGTGLT